MQLHVFTFLIALFFPEHYDTVVLREYNFFLYISCAYHLHHNYHITQNHNFLFDLININSNCLKEPVKFYLVHTVIVFKPTCSVLILHL